MNFPDAQRALPQGGIRVRFPGPGHNFAIVTQARIGLDRVRTGADVVCEEIERMRCLRVEDEPDLLVRQLALIEVEDDLTALQAALPPGKRINMKPAAGALRGLYGLGQRPRQ